MTDKKRTPLEEVRYLLDTLIEDPASMSGLPVRALDLGLRIARRARLLGSFAQNLQDSGALNELPAAAVDQLSSAKTMADARARLALWELDRIAWATRDTAAKPLVVMKGCAYLMLGLPNAAGRIFADVDLLTAKGKLEELEQELNARGWETTKLSPYDQNYYRNWTHELPPLVHREREVEIDLHHNVLPRTARLKPSSAKLLDRARPLPDSPYQVLSDEDVLLHTMTHLMFDADLGDQIRDLLDVKRIAEHYAEKDAGFWRRLLDRAVELDLTRPAYYSLRYCRLLLNASIPEDVLSASEAWAPPRIVVRLMDAMVPRALYPQHPDAPSRVSELCRLLLYMRSHWIRMPPWLLAYHLSYKFFMTRLRRKPRAPS